MSSNTLQPVHTTAETLTEMVFEAIKLAIIDRTLAPGSRVSEAALAEQLNVSKTPVRETLLRLRLIGLVVQTGSGLRVVAPSREGLRAAYEYRIGLERISAELAASRVDESAAGAIRAAADSSLSCARAADRDGFRNWDSEFHSLVARASGNALLASAIPDSLVLTSVLRVRDFLVSSDSVDCGHEHLNIADAIGGGDGLSAAAGMQRHIEHVMSMVLSASAVPTDGIEQF